MFKMFDRKSKRFDALPCVRVRPNKYNLVLVPDLDSAANDEISEYRAKSISLHAHMESQIVRDARQIVDKRSLDEDNHSDCDGLNQRISKMETMLITIVDKLNNLANRTQK